MERSAFHASQQLTSPIVLIFETSASALCCTTGLFGFNLIYFNIVWHSWYMFGLSLGWFLYWDSLIYFGPTTSDRVRARCAHPPCCCRAFQGASRLKEDEPKEVERTNMKQSRSSNLISHIVPKLKVDCTVFVVVKVKVSRCLFWSGAPYNRA
jgi:hypothetical protein